MIFPSLPGNVVHMYARVCMGNGRAHPCYAAPCMHIKRSRLILTERRRSNNGEVKFVYILKGGTNFSQITRVLLGKLTEI